MKKITVILTSAGVMIAFFAIIFVNMTPETENIATKIIAKNDIINLQQGKMLYQQNCTSCHGMNLEGEKNWRNKNPDGSLRAPPHDETGHTWHHSDAILFQYVKLGGTGIAEKFGINNPNSNMPAYKDILSDDEIISIINYIKSTWSKEIQQMQSNIKQ